MSALTTADIRIESQRQSVCVRARLNAIQPKSAAPPLRCLGLGLGLRLGLGLGLGLRLGLGLGLGLGPGLGSNPSPNPKQAEPPDAELHRGLDALGVADPQMRQSAHQLTF